MNKFKQYMDIINEMMDDKEQKNDLKIEKIDYYTDTFPSLIKQNIINSNSSYDIETTKDGEVISLQTGTGNIIYACKINMEIITTYGGETDNGEENHFIIFDKEIHKTPEDVINEENEDDAIKQIKNINDDQKNIIKNNLSKIETYKLIFKKNI